MLVGPSGSGKSTWAAQHYRQQEVVSSDALRAVVGSGEFDLDASADAFALLHQIVAGRARRGLTVVVDTLGLDARPPRPAAGAGPRLPESLVSQCFSTRPRQSVAQRNAARDRPVPARVLGQQLAAFARERVAVQGEGWDEVRTVVADAAASRSRPGPTGRVRAPDHAAARPGGRRRRRASCRRSCSRCRGSPGVPTRPAGCARSPSRRTSTASAAIALMDHLIQIPQVDRAWEPIPEPWVTLGMLAGLDTDLGSARWSRR